MTTPYNILRKVNVIYSSAQGRLTRTETQEKKKTNNQDMKNRIIAFATILRISLAARAQSSMTDDQVLKYLVTDNFHSHKTVKALKYSNVNVTDVGKVRGGYKVKANVELINGMTTVAETCYITLKMDGGMLKVDSISTR